MVAGRYRTLGVCPPGGGFGRDSVYHIVEALRLRAGSLDESICSFSTIGGFLLERVEKWKSERF
jgi:hypothetical protein